ncbi:MAG: hypothetical protein GQ570_07825 [Helicobacteraceae bacterium]|nr:hypothetical protein [Helicobacteraceae bacterium]
MNKILIIILLFTLNLYASIEAGKWGTNQVFSFSGGTVDYNDAMLNDSGVITADPTQQKETPHTEKYFKMTSFTQPLDDSDIAYNVDNKYVKFTYLNGSDANMSMSLYNSSDDSLVSVIHSNGDIFGAENIGFVYLSETGQVTFISNMKGYATDSNLTYYTTNGTYADTRTVINAYLATTNLLSINQVTTISDYKDLDNGNLRFGNGDGRKKFTYSDYNIKESSVNDKGTLNQPFYWDSADNKWQKLTFFDKALINFIGVGGDGTDSWNVNGTVVLSPSLTNQSIDTSGFNVTSSNKGYGTIISTGEVNVGGKALELTQTYTLDPNKTFIKMSTKIKNISGGDITNVRFWVGTDDDYIAGSDSTTKKRGNFVDEQFEEVSTAADRSNVVEITGGTAGIYFYSTSSRADSVISVDYGSTNLKDTAPSANTAISNDDGSYAIYMRLNDLADQASEEFTVYYAAGSTADLADVASELALANALEKTLDEDTFISHGSNDFRDANSVVFSKIKVLSLVANGTLTLNGSSLVVDQEIISSDYANMTYTPNQDFNGTDKYKWQGWDGTQYSPVTYTKFIVEPINDAPTIADVTTGQSVDDNMTIAPFSNITLDDIDSNSVNITITLDNDAKGTLSTNTVSTGSLSTVQAALRAIIFTPTTNFNITVGSSTSVTFTITASDGALNSIATTVTLSSIGVNDAPIISNTTAAQPFNDNTTIAPFSTVTLSDIENDNLSVVSITLDKPENGSLSATTISSNSLAATQALLRAIIFTPTQNIAPLGDTNTTRFTLTISDGALNDEDNVTTVISKSVNGVPTVINVPDATVIEDHEYSFLAQTIDYDDNNLTEGNFSDYIDIDISSYFNADVILNSGDTSNDYIDSSLSNLFTVGLDSSHSALPNDSNYTSTAFHRALKLAYSNSDNGLNAIKNIASSKLTSITSFNKNSYNEVHIFALSGSGDSNLTLKFYYDDNSTELSSMVTVPNWADDTFSESNDSYYVINSLDRYYNNSYLNAKTGVYSVYGFKFDINSDKNLTKIDLIPTISDSNSQAILGMNLMSESIRGTINDDGLITDKWTPVSLPSWLSYRNGMFSGTPPLGTTNGSNLTQTVTMQITDGIDVGEYTFDITVIPNESPTLSDIDNVTQGEDAQGINLTLDVADSDSALDYSATTASSDTSVATAKIVNGQLIVTPIANASGTATITINVTNGGKTTTKTFTYTVNGINDDPIMSSIEDITLDQETTKTITKTVLVTVSDDSADLSYSVTSSNAELIESISVTKIDATHASITYTIKANATGNSDITVTTTDTEGATDSETFNILVAPNYDSLCVDDIKTALNFSHLIGSNSSQEYITKNLTYISATDAMKSICSATITWTSSDATVVSATGVVTQSSKVDMTVSVTATISKDGVSDSKTFLITVPKSGLNTLEALQKASDALGFENIRNKNQKKSEIYTTLILPTTGLADTSISWSSSYESIINSNDGTVNADSSSDTIVDLEATISIDGDHIEKEFNLIVPQIPSDNLSVVTKDTQWLTYATILALNKDNIHITTALDLSITPPNGSTISWSSTNINVLSNNGTINRDVNQDKYISLKATVSKDGASHEKVFLFKVLKKISEDTLGDNSEKVFKKVEESDDDPGEEKIISLLLTEGSQEVQTTLILNKDIKEELETIISEGSVKNILPLKDNKQAIVYLNTDGSTESKLEFINSDDESVVSQINISSSGAKTSISDKGVIKSNVTVDDNTLMSASIEADGSVTHSMSSENNKVTKSVCKLAGAEVVFDEKKLITTYTKTTKNTLGQIIIIEAVVETSIDGKSITRFQTRNLSTSETAAIANTMKTTTPYEAGNSVEINNIDGKLYMKTSAPLSSTDLIVE